MTIRPGRWSSPLSLLTLCCKRMFLEMRCNNSNGEDNGTNGENTDSSTPPGTGFALMLIYPHYEVSPRLLFRTTHLVVEGRFDYKRVRHLRFINEDEDEPNQRGWHELFIHILDNAKNLVALEMEWNPKMSIIACDHRYERPWNPGLDAIRDHSALRHICLRGNVPWMWHTELPQMKGKRVIFEPITWMDRDQTHLAIRKDRYIEARRAEVTERLSTNQSALPHPKKRRLRAIVKFSLRDLIIKSRNW